MRARGVLVAPAFTTLALAAAACALPERDNPSDPAVRPSVVLTVSNGVFRRTSPTEGVCEPADSAVPVFSRGRCLHLSAAGSSDPRGETLRFAFDARYEGAGDHTFDTPALLTTSATFAPMALGTDGERAVAGPRQVRVRAENESGIRADAVAVVDLFNEAPAAVSPGSSVVPFYGPTWEPAPTMTVRLTGTGEDPDLDPLRYCWALRESTVGITPSDVTCSDEPSLVATVETGTAGQAIFDFWVEDGEHASVEVPAIIRLDELPSWAVTSSRVSRLDLDRDLFVVDSSLRGIPAVVPAANPADSRIYYLVGPAQVASAELDGDAPLGPVEVTPYNEFHRIVVAPDSGVGWMLGWDSSNETFEVAAFDLTTLQAIGDRDLDWTGYDLYYGRSFAHLAPDGTLWTAAAAGRAIFQIDPGQGLTPTYEHFFGDGFPAIGGLAIRDVGAGDYEVWLSMNTSELSPEPVGAPEIRVIPVIDGVPGQPETACFDSDPLEFCATSAPGYASELVFLDERHAWSIMTDVGGDTRFAYFEVDATGRRLIERSASPGRRAIDAFADPGSGALTAVLADGSAVVRAGLDGQITELLAGDDRITSLLRLEDGRQWALLDPDPGTPFEAASPYLLVRGDGGLRAPVLMDAPKPDGSARGAIDYASGDLWTGSSVPRAVVRLGGSGRIVDIFSGIEDVSTAERHALPAPWEVLPDPIDGAVWVLTGEEAGLVSVYRAEPSQRVAAFTVSGSRIVDDLSSLRRAVGAAVLPGAGELDLLAIEMICEGDGGLYCFDLYTAQSGAGGITFAPDPVRLTPGGVGMMDVDLAGIAAISRDLEDLGLCVAMATVDGVSVIRLGPDRSEEWRELLDPGDRAVRGLAAAGGDCWIAYSADREDGDDVLALVRGQGDVLTMGAPLGLARITSVVPVRSVPGSPAAPAVWAASSEGALLRVAATTVDLEVEESHPLPSGVRLAAP